MMHATRLVVYPQILAILAISVPVRMWKSGNIKLALYQRGRTTLLCVGGGGGSSSSSSLH